MFESAELGHKISKSEFAKEEGNLRAKLLQAQLALREHGEFPVIILISGIDGAGKGETINDLYRWLDPRYLSTFTFAKPSKDERNRPAMKRYWDALVSKGLIGIYSGSWYSEPIRQAIEKKKSRASLDQQIENINKFEAMLVNEGALVLKFWFHLSKKGQIERLQRLQKDPRNSWRVNKQSWEKTKSYDVLQDVAGHVLRVSNSPWAPWLIVEGTDDNYRSLTVGKLIVEAMSKRLADKRDQNYPVAPPLTLKTDQRDILTSLDLNIKLSPEDYNKQLAQYQGRLSCLINSKKFQKNSLVLVFEGADAAGKGGAIRRLTTAMDARNFQIIPIAAPSFEEKAHPYLWRFWRHIPKHGRVTIFDRSWYGRVLVERVEKFCQEADWLRAYSEINDFEHELESSGVIIIKFWLQISPEEQLLRFKEREQIDFKRYKITEEDWRNREKWDAYHQAVCDMIDRTSSGLSPWVLVEANDKRHARVKILQTVCNILAHKINKG